MTQYNLFLLLEFAFTKNKCKIFKQILKKPIEYLYNISDLMGAHVPPIILSGHRSKIAAGVPYSQIA